MPSGECVEAKPFSSLPLNPALLQALDVLEFRQMTPIQEQSLPPMLGVYRIQDNALRFEPQFPLEPGVTYQAIFHPEQLPGQRDSTRP